MWTRWWMQCAAYAGAVSHTQRIAQPDLLYHCYNCFRMPAQSRQQCKNRSLALVLKQNMSKNVHHLSCQGTGTAAMPCASSCTHCCANVLDSLEANTSLLLVCCMLSRHHCAPCPLSRMAQHAMGPSLYPAVYQQTSTTSIGTKLMSCMYTG